MSYVTNVILHIPLGESKDKINKINDELLFNHNQKFVQVEGDWYGGSKYLECDIYIAAFNYVSISYLVDLLRDLKWEEPENVQLIYQDQEDERFSIININDKEDK